MQNKWNETKYFEMIYFLLNIDIIVAPGWEAAGGFYSRPPYPQPSKTTSSQPLQFPYL